VSLVRFVGKYVTSLIKEKIDHYTVDSNVITFSGSSEFPRNGYDFMIIPTELSSSELSEFLAMTNMSFLVLFSLVI